MKKLVTVLSLAAFVALVGCSTVKGVGKDVKKLGGKIENKAETVQKKQEAKTFLLKAYVVLSIGIIKPLIAIFLLAFCFTKEFT